MTPRLALVTEDVVLPRELPPAQLIRVRQFIQNDLDAIVLRMKDVAIEAQSDMEAVIARYARHGSNLDVSDIGTNSLQNLAIEAGVLRRILAEIDRVTST